MRRRNNSLDFFFFSSRRRHTRLVSDWSSDVCSSDLPTHIVEQDLLVVPALVDIHNAAMLYKRINCCAIFADGLGIKTTGFAVGEIFQIGRASCRERV